MLLGAAPRARHAMRLACSRTSIRCLRLYVHAHVHVPIVHGQPSDGGRMPSLRCWHVAEARTGFGAAGASCSARSTRGLRGRREQTRALRAQRTHAVPRADCGAHRTGRQRSPRAQGQVCLCRVCAYTYTAACSVLYYGPCKYVHEVSRSTHYGYTEVYSTVRGFSLRGLTGEWTRARFFYAINEIPAYY